MPGWGLHPDELDEEYEFHAAHEDCLMDSNEFFKLDDCKCIAETSKALLITCPEMDEDFWIPTSQVHDDSEVFEKDHEGTLVISLWLARQRGWM